MEFQTRLQRLRKKYEADQQAGIHPNGLDPNIPGHGPVDVRRLFDVLEELNTFRLAELKADSEYQTPEEAKKMMRDVQARVATQIAWQMHFEPGYYTLAEEGYAPEHRSPSKPVSKPFSSNSPVFEPVQSVPKRTSGQAPTGTATTSAYQPRRASPEYEPVQYTLNIEDGIWQPVVRGDDASSDEPPPKRVKLDTGGIYEPVMSHKAVVAEEPAAKRVKRDTGSIWEPVRPASDYEPMPPPGYPPVRRPNSNEDTDMGGT